MGEDEKPKPANHRRASSQYIVLNRMQEKENLLLLLLINKDGWKDNKQEIEERRSLSIDIRLPTQVYTCLFHLISCRIASSTG